VTRRCPLVTAYIVAAAIAVGAVICCALHGVLLAYALRAGMLVISGWLAFNVVVLVVLELRDARKNPPRSGAARAASGRSSSPKVSCADGEPQVALVFVQAGPRVESAFLPFARAAALAKERNGEVHAALERAREIGATRPMATVVWILAEGCGGEADDYWCGTISSLTGPPADGGAPC
jgi:hypothetical protein